MVVTDHKANTWFNTKPAVQLSSRQVHRQQALFHFDFHGSVSKNVVLGRILSVAVQEWQSLHSVAPLLSTTFTFFLLAKWATVMLSTPTIRATFPLLKPDRLV